MNKIHQKLKILTITNFSFIFLQIWFQPFLKSSHHNRIFWESKIIDKVGSRENLRSKHLNINENIFQYYMFTAIWVSDSSNKLCTSVNGKTMFRCAKYEINMASQWRNVKKATPTMLNRNRIIKETSLLKLKIVNLTKRMQFERIVSGECNAILFESLLSGSRHKRYQDWNVLLPHLVYTYNQSHYCNFKY